MHSAVYPAKLLKRDDVVLVSFPDLEGCFSDGATIAEATKKAQEALGLYLASMQERRLEIPQPSDPADINCETSECVALISTDVDKYHKYKAVKKTLTIPGWLNEQAEEQRVNFSQVLQSALKEILAPSNAGGALR